MGFCREIIPQSPEFRTGTPKLEIIFSRLPNYAGFMENKEKEHPGG
jgi:hypothetical protein